MASDSLAQFRWLAGYGSLHDIFCVSFFHRLEPDEVLLRFGAAEPEGRRMTFDDLRELVGEYVAETNGGSGGGYIGVVPAGAWSVAIELWGWAATLPEVVNDLSFGGEVVAINRHDYAEDHFVHAVDGTVITGFAPRRPTVRHGSEADRLNDLMSAVGLDPHDEDGPDGTPIASAFALAAEITGVTFTPDFLRKPVLVGDVRDQL